MKTASISSGGGASRRRNAGTSTDQDTVTGGSESSVSRRQAGERKAFPACQQHKEKDQRRPDGGIGLNGGHGTAIIGAITTTHLVLKMSVGL